MKALLTIMLAAGLSAAVLFAQSDPKTDAPTTQPTTQPTTKPVNKMCAVQQDEEADPTITYTYNGKVYAFCCKECIPEFKKNPEKYVNAK